MRESKTLKLTNNEVNKLIEVWKVLEILTVSFDRIGSVEADRGTEFAQKALSDFIEPQIVNRIAKARGILVNILDKDEEIGDLLDKLADNEIEMGYWNNKQ